MGIIGDEQVQPIGTWAVTTQVLGALRVGLRVYLRFWTNIAQVSGWMSAQQQLAAEAFQSLRSRDMGSASLAPWLM
jgi:hypothetical protein